MIYADYYQANGAVIAIRVNLAQHFANWAMSGKETGLQERKASMNCGFAT
jgi:hypothetical protein